MEAPAFDPTKPFDLVGAPPFDPSKPFETGKGEARAPLDYEIPAPPDGVIIHERNRSYVTGKKGPEVDLTNVPDDQRDLARAALAKRLDMGGMNRELMPYFQGLSAGYGDEAVSALHGARTALSGGSFKGGYDLAQEVQRQELEQRRKEAPIASAAGEVAGALTQTPAWAAGLGRVAGLPLAGQAGIGAGVGGAYGGLQGFGSGDGLQDRIDNAATGAATGAGIGLVAPFAAAGLGKAATAIMDSVTSNRVLQSLGMDRPAGGALIRALDADAAFTGKGASNIAAAGKDAMLVDAGPTSRAVLDTAMQRGGPATRVAREAIEARTAQAGQGLNTALDRTLGAPSGTESAITGIREGTSGARQAAYDAAYNSPIDYSDKLGTRLQNLLKRVPEDALAAANKLMRLDGAHSKQVLAQLADDGSVTFMRLPDVRQIDYITRGLNQIAKTGEGAGALGGQTPIGAKAQLLSNEIRKTVRQLVPAYGEALDTAAEPISRIEAIKLGTQMLGSGVTRDEMAQALNGMGRAERDAVKQGLRSHLDELFANVKATVTEPNTDVREALQAAKSLSGRAVYDKLQMLLGDPEARQLFKEIRQNTKALELYAATARNSATFGRGAVDSAIKTQNEPGVIGAALEGRPVNATRRLVQALTGRTPEAKLAQEDELYRQLAEALTGRRGQDAIDALNALGEARRASLANATFGKRLGANLGAGSALLEYQSLQRLLNPGQEKRQAGDTR